MSHNCTTAMGRYPTCSCGSGSWPCSVEHADRAAAEQRAHDQRIARAVVDAIERRCHA